MKAVAGMFFVGALIALLPTPFNFIVLGAMLLLGAFSLYLSLSQALYSAHHREI